MSPASEQVQPIEVFYSYAHKDEELRKELETHLSLLWQRGLITGWHDRNITAGSEWEDEIDAHLMRAQIVLLLVSADFLASDYCYSQEMIRAMTRHQVGDAKVIPIIVRPCSWKEAPFGKLAVLPPDGKAVTSREWHSRDEAWVTIEEALRQVIATMTAEQQTSSASSPQRIWMVPYRRNPFFTGREDLLERLREALCTTWATALGQAQAISGLGGIGKTQTALEYAYRYQEEYQLVGWIQADTSEQLLADYQILARHLALPEHQLREPGCLVRAVKGWLETHGSWLLIFDNADELSLLEDFLPQGGRGHLLLTTRAHQTEPLARRLEVETMAEEVGALFLLKRARLLPQDASLESASIADQVQARHLSRLLGGLPLALDQAGAYIDEAQSTLADYLRFYQSETARKKLLAQRGKSSSGHVDPVATTWSFSFAKVEQSNPAAADLLRVCAFLAPDAIPEDLLVEGAKELGPSLQALAADPFAFNEAIRELLTFSLVRRTRTTHTLSVHRLVQQVLKDTMDAATQRQWAERVVRAVDTCFPYAEVTNWPRCQQLLPHALVCADLIDQWNLSFAEAAHLLHQAGLYLHHMAQYNEAERLSQRALRIHEQVQGPEHPETAQTLHQLGVLAQAQGKYNEAERLSQRALRIHEQVQGPEHPETASTRSAYAQLLRTMKRDEEAAALEARRGE